MKQLLAIFIFMLITINASICPAAAETTAYKIGVNDIIRVEVFRSPDLKIEARVSELGAINFPLVGSVQVEGKSASEVERDISKILVDKALIKSPQVNVFVLDYQSKAYSIIGNVQKPGKYPIDKPLYLSDAIALAGGVTILGSETVTVISYKDDVATNKKIYDLRNIYANSKVGSNPKLNHNDVIYVPKYPVFYIYGEIKKPGEYRVDQNLRVSQALAIAGSLTPRGTARGVVIERLGEDGKVKNINANINDFVMENDVINIKESVF